MEKKSAEGKKELIQVNDKPYREVNQYALPVRKPVNQQPVGGIPGLQARIKELRETAKANIGWEPGMLLNAALGRIEELERKIPVERARGLVERHSRVLQGSTRGLLESLLWKRQYMMSGGFEALPAVQAPPPATQSVPYSPEREAVRDRRRKEEEERRRRSGDMSVTMY